jgi:hypothetical protein
MAKAMKGLKFDVSLPPKDKFPRNEETTYAVAKVIRGKTQPYEAVKGWKAVQKIVEKFWGGPTPTADWHARTGGSYIVKTECLFTLEPNSYILIALESDVRQGKEQAAAKAAAAPNN